MWVNFHQSLVSIASWRHEGQMLNYLSRCELGQIMLGQTAQQKNEFFTCTISEFNAKRRFGIGICSEGHGLKPGILLHPEQTLIMIGFNSEIAIANIQEKRIVRAQNLDALFYTFFYLASEKIALVLHEIGLVALSLDGTVIWRFSRDIVTNAQVRGATIYLEFVDADPIVLSIRDGELLSKSGT